MNKLLKNPVMQCPYAKLLLPVFVLMILPLTGHEERAADNANDRDAAQSATIRAASVSIPKRNPPLTSTMAPSVKKPAKTSAGPSKMKYLAGEDPEFAKRCGWPVKYPEPSFGSILPDKRIVAYYGNPLSKRMGVLGQYPKEEMLRRLKSEVDMWEKADPSHPVQPALHLIAVVAQSEPGKAGKYRLVIPDKIVKDVHGWAREANAILFIDIQTGHDDIRSLLPRFEWVLKNADVHLAIDPEFNLIKSRKQPGSQIGSLDAADINYASAYLQKIVKEHGLPPKILVIHRFTRMMVTNARQVKVSPEVEIVINMDGWGAPRLKRDSYRDYIVREPVQFTGFKLFYHNDTKRGDPLLTPQEVLRLNPSPIYIQYQ